jgi:hypothetical protein
VGPRPDRTACNTAVPKHFSERSPRLCPFFASRAPDRIGSGARRTPSCRLREVAFVLIRPVRRPIDRGGLSGLACRSPGPARSTREEAADVHCGSGSWGGWCLSMGGYVTGTGATETLRGSVAVHVRRAGGVDLVTGF